MKKPVQLGSILMLCTFLAAVCTSCKKENPAFVPEANKVALVAEDSINGIARTTAVYQRKNLLFNFTAEASNSLTVVSNNSTTAWASLQRCCTYSTQRSNTVARSGTYSTRYELNKTDADVGYSKRSETARYSKGELAVKVERWYGASYYMPADYINDASPELVTQWHTNVGNPPLALWVKQGVWNITMFGNQLTPVGSIEKNKWTDFVYHVKWSTTSDGLVEVWKNGVKVFTKTGANILPGTTYGAYFRTGIYKWPWKSGSTPPSTTTKRVLYIDDVRVGNAAATYNDVAPGL